MSINDILKRYLTKVQVLLDREKQNCENDQMINLLENQIDRYEKLIKKLESNSVESFTSDENQILNDLEPFIREIEQFKSLCLEISKIKSIIIETLLKEHEKNNNLLKLRAMVMFILYQKFFDKKEIWSRHPQIPEFKLPKELIGRYIEMILLTDRFNVHSLEDYQKEIQMIMDAFNQMKTEISTRIQTISSSNLSEICDQISYLERIIQSFNQLEQKIHRECLIDLEQKQAQIAEMKRYLDENTTGSILILEYVEKNCSCPDYVYLRCRLKCEYNV
jgi:hypothetical protein